MVLSPGHGSVHGVWYWTDYPMVPSEHTYGSLNWWRGTSAVFPGVGEVSRGAWSNGSSPGCGVGLPDFHLVLSPYNTVKWRFGTSGALHLCTQSLGDAWFADITIGPRTYRLNWSPDTPLPGTEAMEIQTPPITGPAVTVRGVSVDLTTHIYTWRTVPNFPAGWPGGDVQVLLSNIVPTPVCFTPGDPGYTGVRAVGPGLASTAMVHFSGDTWTINYTLSGHSVQLEANCGIPGPVGQENLVLTYNGLSHVYAADSYDPLTHLWHYTTTTGVPTGWPGGVVTFQTHH